ncbi:MAG: choice-of-anchor Q domain-containing protein [Planctomycetota bacterium]
MAMKENRKSWLIVSMVLLVIGGAANAKTIYVDADAAGSGTGTNWANAYPYLQDALADANTSAEPVEIRVARGTYKPDEGAGVTDGDREATFELFNGVTIEGGYAGYGELDPNARDTVAYESILSGDLDGNDVYVSNPADLRDEPTRGENSYHVVVGGNTDESAIMDGLTITAGNANGTSDSDKHGGGVYCVSGSPVLIKCTLTENSASGAGGAIYDWEHWLKLTSCTISRNSANRSGGGVYQDDGRPISIKDCIFIDNHADRGAAMSVGYWDKTQEAYELANCVFVSNLASRSGGVISYYHSYPTYTNCVFINNAASSGYGGVSLGYNYGAVGRESFNNCIFSGNSAGVDGGVYHTSHGSPTFRNCTFSENSAGGNGGVLRIFLNGGTVYFENCILWGNTAGGEGPQIAIETASATVNVNYSDVQGGESDVYDITGGPALDWGAGNINSAPCFVDADGADNTVGTEDDNLRLANGSPCIDAGDNTAVPAGINDDLNGFPRFIDDLCTADTGNGTAPIVDMGAYEFLRSDINSNGSVDFEDYCVIADRWRETSCGLCGGADLTCDGNVDWNDVRELVAYWLW